MRGLCVFHNSVSRFVDTSMNSYASEDSQMKEYFCLCILFTSVVSVVSFSKHFFIYKRKKNICVNQYLCNVT